MASIYWRARATKDSKGNWQLDSNGGWAFLSVPTSAGKPPAWLAVAKKAAADSGRGFQFRLPDGNWSGQYRSIKEAEDAAKGRPLVAAAEARGLTVKESAANLNRQSIRESVAAYLAKKTGKKADSTIKVYTFNLNEFISLLPRSVRFVDQIDSGVMEAYLRKLEAAKAAPKTIQNKVMVVCFMLKSAGMEQPSKLVELPTVEDEPVSPYSESELRKLFAAMTPEEVVRYRFFLDTACREKEVAHAQWSDIDWKKSEYLVRRKTWKAPNGLLKKFTTKNHKSRVVPITRELLDMLRERKEAKDAKSIWIFPNEEGQPEGHFLRKFKKVAYRAGLNCGQCESDGKSCKTVAEGCEKHFLHKLRKTRATFWHENGVSIRTIQYRLSHESLETTMMYLGIQDSAKTVEQDNIRMY